MTILVEFKERKGPLENPKSIEVEIEVVPRVDEFVEIDHVRVEGAEPEIFIRGTVHSVSYVVTPLAGRLRRIKAFVLLR